MTVKHPKVYIALLNWNGLRDTLECLESVYKLDYPNFEVVVVDNGSKDDPGPVMRRQYPRALLIRNPENLGYTGGNNVAMSYALEQGADYIWLLNNDTTVDSACLSRIVATAEASALVGLVSPVIYYHDAPTRVQFAGSRIDIRDLSLEFPDPCRPVPEIFTAGPAVSLWGTALLIKAVLARRIGLLDEKYFAYWEDTDYSLRALTAGYANRVAPSASVFHKTSCREPIRPSLYYHYYMERNRLFLSRDHLPLARRIRAYRRQLATLAITMQTFHDSGARAAAAARLSGFLDGLRSAGGPMPEERSGWLGCAIASILLWHPYFLADVLRGNFRSLWRQVFGTGLYR
jgi:GT2 family glycosyltransferase